MTASFMFCRDIFLLRLDFNVMFFKNKEDIIKIVDIAAGEDMTDKQIGRLVKEIRGEKNISAIMLAKGLCDESTIIYFEKGKRKLDNLLLYRIFDRLGIESDEFAIMVNDEQYEYHLWKRQTFLAIRKQKWDELEDLLKNRRIAIEVKYHKKLQYQYFYKIKAVLEAEKYHNYVLATELLKEAIEETMPDIFTMKRDKFCLGAEEIHILLVYLYYGVKAKKIDKVEKEGLQEKIENYLILEYMEEKKLVKLYPKMVAIWLHIDDLSADKKRELCERAIRLLRDTRRLHDILEILRLYIGVLDNDEDLIFYEKQYENFCEILQYAEIDIGFHPEILAVHNEKLFLIAEYLYTERRKKGWTQQKISEDICEPETYSRIETGKHVPVKTSMYKLTEKLDISWCFYRGEIEINSLRTYRIYQLVKKCSNREQDEKSLYWLGELKKLLDMTNPVNVQYVKFEKIIVERRLGRIDVQEAYKCLEEILKLTTTVPTESQFCYYSQTELEILGEMGKMLYLQKRYEEGILLLKCVIENQRKSRIKWEYQWNGIEFILRILTDLYFGAQRYKEANDISKYVMRIELEREEAISLPNLLDCMADNYEHIGEQYSILYMKLYRQIYYITDFMGFEDFFEFIEKYYKENFNPNIKWY